MGEVGIAELAERIARDLSRLRDWSVEMGPPPPGIRMRSLAEQLSLPLSDQLATGIQLLFRGRRKLRLSFYSEPNLTLQEIEALSQLQDVVVETMLDAWPRCPIHDHVLVPIGARDELYWQCPSDQRMRIVVGQLNDEIHLTEPSAAPE